MSDQLPLREYEILAPYTAWRIGGPARWFITATSTAMLRAAAAWADEHSVPLCIVGGGSNMLISDAGWPGLVVRYRAREQHWHAHGDELLLDIDAGAPMAGTARRLAADGIGGLEWAEGLPGTVGGAIYGNAGCYGGSMAGNLIAAQVLLPDGQIETWLADKFGFAYRSSALKRADAAAKSGPMVLSATLRLYRDDPLRLAATIAETAASRRAKTPSGSSCGSVFKNPPNTTAGILLDQAGLKGCRVGAAQVAEKHANYIINLGGATASDVLRLTEIMRNEVLRHSGIELQLEVQLIGVQP